MGGMAAQGRGEEKGVSERAHGIWTVEHSGLYCRVFKPHVQIMAHKGREDARRMGTKGRGPGSPPCGTVRPHAS